MFKILGFEVMTNYQPICEAGQIISKMAGVFKIDDGADMCAKSNACTYFGLSTVAGLGGLPATYANTLWLCSGTPTFAFHLGWLAAGKATAMPPKEQLFKFADEFDGALV